MVYIEKVNQPPNSMSNALILIDMFVTKRYICTDQCLLIYMCYNVSIYMYDYNKMIRAFRFFCTKTRDLKVLRNRIKSVNNNTAVDYSETYKSIQFKFSKRSFLIEIGRQIVLLIKSLILIWIDVKLLIQFNSVRNYVCYLNIKRLPSCEKAGISRWTYHS